MTVGLIFICVGFLFKSILFTKIFQILGLTIIFLTYKEMSCDCLLLKRVNNIFGTSYSFEVYLCILLGLCGIFLAVVSIFSALNFIIIILILLIFSILLQIDYNLILLIFFVSLLALPFLINNQQNAIAEMCASISVYCLTLILAKLVILDNIPS